MNLKILVSNDNRIKNVFSGDTSCIEISPTDIIYDIPNDISFYGQYGEDIRMWNTTTFEKRPDDELIADGYITLAEDEKIVNHMIVKKTDAELLTEGLITLAADEVLDGDYIRKKTLQELYDEGSYIAPAGYEVYNNQLYNIEEYKNVKKNEITEDFDNVIKTGHFTSIALGIEVDCRRSVAKNDLQNVQGLISYMTRNTIATIDYKGYTESATATISNLESLTYEMEDYVLELYQQKWSKLTEVQVATTIAILENINW